MKKEWVTPNVELVSTDAIQAGLVSGVEGAPVGTQTGNGQS